MYGACIIMFFFHFREKFGFTPYRDDIDSSCLISIYILVCISSESHFTQLKGKSKNTVFPLGLMKRCKHPGLILFLF